MPDHLDSPAAAEVRPLLELCNVSRSFGGVHAVNDCSFAVEQASITGLIGPNGAGKTTTFNLITGATRVDRGVIRFRGRRIDGGRPSEMFRRGVVRTFQVPRPLSGLSVIENTMLTGERQREHLWDGWLWPRRIRDRERELFDEAHARLEFVGLAPLADSSPDVLSGGQRKLLEFARALMARPALMLLDEPAAGVYPALAQQLMALVHELRENREMSFLIIEHDMDLVTRWCERVVVMAGGHVISTGTPAEIHEDARVVDAYLGASS